MMTEFEFEIDLNMMRGERAVSHVENLLPGLRRREKPWIGETVTAVDEDGAKYLAVVESMDDDGFVTLYVKAESRVRPADVETDPPVGNLQTVKAAIFRPKDTMPTMTTPPSLTR